MMIKKPFSVTEITKYIKDTIENDIELSNVYVRGEVSNFKFHSSGHMYFTLKDENAKIKCVMFKTYNIFLKFMPEDGMNVIASGSISVYERDGQYQLYCTRMEPDGIGALYKAYEQLKDKLEKEGLFDKSHKKPVPLFPEKIGVVTSRTGAVIKDIINVASSRFYNIKIVLYPAKVQGTGAAESIKDGIEYFNSRDDIDVIIIGRGGGSIEELFAFNEEIVARAIYNSKIPVISAVGHETDFTISDFTADIRASTPSHAAEIAVPSLDDLKFKIESLKSDLKSDIKNTLSNDRQYISEINGRIKINSPQNKMVQTSQFLDNLELRLVGNAKNRVTSSKNIFSLLIKELDGLSPLKTLERGYSLVEKEGKVIKSLSLLNANDDFSLIMQDGIGKCKFIKKTEGNKWQTKSMK